MYRFGAVLLLCAMGLLTQAASAGSTRPKTEEPCGTGCICGFDRFRACNYECCGDMDNCRYFDCIAARDIDPVVTVSDDGRRLRVTGHIECSPEDLEIGSISVSVTQNGTGALAEGYTTPTTCGDTDTWAIHAKTRGKPEFVEGHATACAIALMRGIAEQWCVDVTITATE